MPRFEPGLAVQEADDLPMSHHATLSIIKKVCNANFENQQNVFN